MLYLWIKAAHVIAVIAWMAAMLYLPRLLVYHCEAPAGSPQSETFKIMERRLLRAIMLPAMIAVWITGPWLAWWEGVTTDGWLIAKVVLVVALSGFQGALGRWLKDFARDANTHPQSFYRIANEVPTLLMAAIVILVIVKPF